MAVLNSLVLVAYFRSKGKNAWFIRTLQCSTFMTLPKKMFVVIYIQKLYLKIRKWKKLWNGKIIFEQKVSISFVWKKIPATKKVNYSNHTHTQSLNMLPLVLNQAKEDQLHASNTKSSHIPYQSLHTHPPSDHPGQSHARRNDSSHGQGALAGSRRVTESKQERRREMEERKEEQKGKICRFYSDGWYVLLIDIFINF